MLTVVVVRVYKLDLPQSLVVYTPFVVSRTRTMRILVLRQCRSSESQLNLSDQQRGLLELVRQIHRPETAIAPIATAQGHVLLIQQKMINSNRSSVIRSRLKLQQHNLCRLDNRAQNLIRSWLRGHCLRVLKHQRQTHPVFQHPTSENRLTA